MAPPHEDPRDAAMGLRVPPHNHEAEQALLGSVLLDNAAFDRVSDIVSAEHFYRVEHREIWSVLVRQIMSHRTADALTVFDALGRDLEYLTALTSSVSSSRSARRYAEIVNEHWRERRLITIGDEIVGDAYNAPDSGTCAERVDKAVTALLGVSAANDLREPRSIDQILGPWVDRLNDAASSEVELGIATGLRNLDKLTSGGMRRGELWVVGARPSMGKSALSLTIARNVAQRHRVLFLSQEDSEDMLVSRLVASAGRVNLADLRNPRHAPQEAWSGVTEGVEQLTPLHLSIDDQAGLTLMDVRRKIQQAKRRGGVDLVVVDYLQLMQGKAETRNRELGDIANGLKTAAKDFDITILLLSQLSRKADERSGPPQMSDLRESGDIEGAADFIGMLFREWMRKPSEENRHFAELNVCKQKNGPTDTVRLHFDGRHQLFTDWEGPRPRAGTGRSSGADGGMD